MATKNKPKKTITPQKAAVVTRKKVIDQPKAAPSMAHKKTLKQFLFRAGIFLIIILGAVFYTDSKGYFNPDYSNDHTRRKWNAYYDFTKKQDVDVVLVGNSHLYTGLSPENLSNALGANCFILASPGTTLTDSYFALKEAIRVSKPKIAVVETFTINDYHSHELKLGALADQLKSFSARKDVSEKIFSTPVLFTSGNYLSAWSNSIRNHSFIFTDREQIDKNIELMKNKPEEQKGLYLGRFIRFTSGLEDSTLLKYNKPGFAAYDGKKYQISDEAKEYIGKTVELCRENHVKLVFLTLPMYYRHVKDYQLVKSKLSTELARYNPLWLDLQSPYDYKAFTPDCFENTVKENQHMTYHGSLVAAYKLAHFIKETCSDVLRDRSNEISWKQLFYANDGYFENHSPENDGVNRILLKKSKSQDGISINEIDLIQQQGGYSLLVKADKQNNPNLYSKTVQVLVEANVGGKQIIAPVEAEISKGYDPLNHYLFSSPPFAQGINVLAIKSVSLKK
ncbi:MAG: hypothetical protein Q8904_00870 [Bacteroidota bacterium]|nr:hypothetical protein [Bacteroidota bacterium]